MPGSTYGTRVPWRVHIEEALSQNPQDSRSDVAAIVRPVNMRPTQLLVNQEIGWTGKPGIPGEQALA